MRPSALHVEVDEACIALGGLSVFTGPVALAIAQARAVAGHNDALVSVTRRPSLPSLADARMQPESYDALTTWFARLDGVDVPLARRAQIFCSAWQYGPQSGPFVVGRKAGRALTRPYCEIVVPFAFDLTLDLTGDGAKRG